KESGANTTASRTRFAIFWHRSRSCSACARASCTFFILTRGQHCLASIVNCLLPRRKSMSPLPMIVFAVLVAAPLPPSLSVEYSSRTIPPDLHTAPANPPTDTRSLYHHSASRLFHIRI